MIQQLDMMTLMVMCLLINTVLAVMLLMVGRHIRQARGVRDWSLGIVLISLALVIAIHLVRHKDDIWLLMPTNMLFGYGNGLFLVAIRKFRKKETHALLPLAIGAAAVLINALFLFVIPALPMRLLFISLFYAGVNAFCAHELLRSTSGRLHSAYLWTGSVFALFSLVMFARAMTAWLAPERVLLQSSHPALPATGLFAFVGLMLLCSTVGYVLLLTYRMAAEMERLASHDSLTGALNRRSLDVVAQPALAQASRNSSGLTALLIDIDHFKKVNDRYGHQVGDEVLRRFADIVRNQIRAGDHFARYGGEEFCILMPDAHKEAGYNVAERLRRAFSETELQGEKGEPFHCTVSLGVADSRGCDSGFEALLRAADHALYHAKASGRNRVVVHSADQADTAENPLPA